MGKTIIVVGIIAVLVLGGIFFLKPALTGDTITEIGEYDEFAQCLTDSGLKMYGTEWCGHCKNQKALFGSSFQHIDYTDCDKDSEICTNEGVGGYPTWKINGESYPGGQSFEKLSSLSGCEL